MRVRDYRLPHTIFRHRFGTCCRRALSGALLSAAVISAARSDPAPTAPQDLNFDIVRNGAVVGRHQIIFRRAGELLRVESDVTINITLLFFSLYRYTQTREEVWRSGKLIAFASRSNDDGTPYDIKGEAEPDGVKVTSGKLSWILPANSVPASYWNMSTVTAKGPLVDAQSGRVIDVKPMRVGDETVMAGRRPIIASHYRIVAETPRDVWYDASGRWVKLRMAGEDGSLIEWVLK